MVDGIVERRRTGERGLNKTIKGSVIESESEEILYDIGYIED